MAITNTWSCQGMVYISQPTELGTLYSREELEAIAQVCRKHDVKLFVDGARPAYTLACPENDVTLADLAQLCDAFYIGGTKCGAMFGERRWSFLILVSFLI